MVKGDQVTVKDYEVEGTLVPKGAGGLPPTDFSGHGRVCVASVETANPNGAEADRGRAHEGRSSTGLVEQTRMVMSTHNQLRRARTSNRGKLNCVRWRGV